VYGVEGRAVCVGNEIGSRTAQAFETQRRADHSGGGRIQNRRGPTTCDERSLRVADGCTADPGRAASVRARQGSMNAKNATTCPGVVPPDAKATSFACVFLFDRARQKSGEARERGSNQATHRRAGNRRVDPRSDLLLRPELDGEGIPAACTAVIPPHSGRFHSSPRRSRRRTRRHASKPTVNMDADHPTPGGENRCRPCRRRGVRAQPRREKLGVVCDRGSSGPRKKNRSGTHRRTHGPTHRTRGAEILGGSGHRLPRLALARRKLLDELANDTLGSLRSTDPSGDSKS